MINTVHASYDDLADALDEASNEINKLIEGTGFRFSWEYPGFAAFNNKNASIQVAATPGWDGFKGVAIQITDNEGDQINGTEDIPDIILDKLTIEDYVRKIKVLLTDISIEGFLSEVFKPGK